VRNTWRQLTEIAIANWILCQTAVEFLSMTNKLNLTLTDELRRFVDFQTGDEGCYATPGEYIRDLIRRDMQDWKIAADIAQGIREVAEGRFASESILDILNEG
jgi:antitoxin ParD1/3/4